jgi:hypothetical protein
VVQEERFNPVGLLERPLLPSSSLGTTPNRDGQLDDVVALMVIGVPPDPTPAPAGKRCRLGLTAPFGDTWVAGCTTALEVRPMNEVTFPDKGWFKSTRSEPNGGSCVDVNLDVPGLVAVRHSKRVTGPTIVYTDDEWEAFLLGAKDGEFDLKR